VTQAFWTLMLFSVWNLLILAAIWRVSARAVDRAREEAITQAANAFVQRQATVEPRKRTPKKLTVEE